MSIFGTHKLDRVQHYLDGQNFYGTLRRMGRKANWTNFHKLLAEETRLIRANYYMGITPYNAQSEKFHNMLRHIEDIGFTVKARQFRDFGTECSPACMVTPMTADMITAAYTDTQHVVLYSGDGRMIDAVEQCKAADVRVTVVSHNDVVSQDLRDIADTYIPLDKLPDSVFFD
jgi:uncharacterized LabA/DUF88 family protein